MGLLTSGWKVSSTGRPPGFHSAPRGWLGKFPETPTLAGSGRRCLVSQARGISLPLPLAPMLVCHRHHPWEISKLHRAREQAPAGNLHRWCPCVLWCDLGALSQPCLPTAPAFPARVRGGTLPPQLSEKGWLGGHEENGSMGCGPKPGLSALGRGWQRSWGSASIAPHSDCGLRATKHHKRVWPVATGPWGPPRGQDPFSPSPPGSHRSGTSARWLSQRSYFSSLILSRHAQALLLHDTPHTARGKQDTGSLSYLETELAGKQSEESPSKGNVLEARSAPAARDKRRMRFPADILYFLRSPACLGSAPRSAFLRLTGCWDPWAVSRPRVASGPC